MLDSDSFSQLNIYLFTGYAGVNQLQNAEK